MKRRSVLQLGAVGSVSLLGTELAAKAERENKALIWVWLGGGISHIEFTHPLKSAPQEFRSVNGVISAGEYEIGADFPEIAKVGNLFTPVRSFGHRDANHYTATHWVMTGYNGTAIPENGPQKEPSYGSLISFMSGANADNGMSTYVKTGRIAHDDAAWIGSTHMGFETNKEGINNLRLNIDKGRFLRRNQMVDTIDKRGDYLYTEQTKLRQQAVQVILGQAAEAFDVDTDVAGNKLYRTDKSPFCKNLLMARRVIEAGAKFVTVTHDGWDMHSDISAGFKSRAADLDFGLATLVQDLKDRGMLDDTLIVVASEFGRTSKINLSSGRDHQNSLVSLMFAGGNYSHGNAIGTYDEKAIGATSNMFSPFNVTATIFNHFNYDVHHKFIDNIQRPRYIVEGDVKSIL